MILGWFVNHFVLRTICQEEGINIRKYHPEVTLVFGTMGGIFLMGNTANLDTGYQNTKLHVFCAGRFFIFTILAQIYNTIIVALLSKKTKLISKWNLYLKYFVLILFLLQVIDSAIKGISWLEFSGENSDKGKFLEWTMTATVIIMFMSIGYDANRFELGYV